MGWLNAEEQRVLRFVAERFDLNQRDFQTSEVYEELEMAHERLMTCVRRLESFGAVANTEAGDDIIVRSLPRSIDLVRELDQRAEAERSARPDLVEQFKATVRQNPVAATIILTVLGLGVLIALVNQIWDLIAKIAGVTGD